MILKLFYTSLRRLKDLLTWLQQKVGAQLILAVLLLYLALSLKGLVFILLLLYYILFN